MIGDEEIATVGPVATEEDVFMAVLPLGEAALPLPPTRIMSLRIALDLGARPAAIRAIAARARTRSSSPRTDTRVSRAVREIVIYSMAGVGKWEVRAERSWFVDPKIGTELLFQVEVLLAEVEAFKTECFRTRSAAEKMREVSVSLGPLPENRP